MISVVQFLTALISGIQTGIIIYGLGLIKYELAVASAVCVIGAAILNVLHRHYANLYIQEYLKEKKL